MTNSILRNSDRRRSSAFVQEPPEPVYCRQSERCAGCPYPRHGIICWHRDGTCLRTDTLHHNCVFVGVDENGEARHAHLRSTNSQGKVFRINVEGSEAKHSFHKDGTDRSLYVFEAPIDLLSHITLYPTGWLEHSYVACCGTSVQPVLERLRQNPKLNMVYLCLDNDEAGEDACENMMEVLEEMDVDVERLRPQGKDWNDDLCAKRGGHG